MKDRLRWAFINGSKVLGIIVAEQLLSPLIGGVVGMMMHYFLSIPVWVAILACVVVTFVVGVVLEARRRDREQEAFQELQEEFRLVGKHLEENEKDKTRSAVIGLHRRLERLMRTLRL